MCGIAGVLRIHEPGAVVPHPLEAIPEAWLDVLDDGTLHRGPDGEGRFRDRATRADGSVVDVAFVHRRLSIIDHAGGHQPMVHDGERLRPDLTYRRGEAPKLAHELCPGKALVAVVFNGCIYNQRALRAELEASGHRFETDHSDTEVLVHGWRAWGNGLINRLDAMHGSGFWNRHGAVFGMMRDLAGEKPVFDVSLGHSLAFSSCPTSLYRLGVDRKLWLVEPERTNLESFRCVTNGDAVPRPVDFLQHGCGGGASTVTDGDGLSVYFNTCTNIVVPHSRIDTDSLQVLHDSLIAHAVRSRLEADVPLGVFLSGGLDSGLIAAIAKRQIPGLKTFTLRMPDARFDESHDAAETAKAIGSDHTTLECEPDPAGDLVRLIRQLGLPFGDSSLLPTYWLCKAAREHVKVALSGDGGDELFGGYRRHAIAPMLNRWHRVLRLVPDGLLDRRVPGSRREYLSRLAVAARHNGYRELLAIFQTPDLRRLIPMFSGRGLDADGFDRIADPLRYDFEHYLPDDLLRKTDTASMAVALEVRAPFLARELVEAALRTPLDVLMPGGERKGLLKRVARKYLPDHVVDRPKRGFAIPIGRWFRDDYGGLRQLLYDHLESAEPFPGLGEAGIEIDMGFVRQMLREHDAAGERSINPWHGRDHSQRLYMLLVLSIWAKWVEGLRSEQKKDPSIARGDL